MKFSAFAMECANEGPPFWKISTIRPYAAPTDSRFITIAFAGTTIERNTTVRSRNDSPSTSAMMIGV